MSKFCPNCGTQNTDDSRYCMICGFCFHKKEPTTNPVPPIGQPQVTTNSFQPSVAKIVINRKSQMAGCAQNFDVYLNNNYIGVLKNGKSLEFNVYPGTHILFFKSRLKGLGRDIVFRCAVNNISKTVELQVKFKMNVGFTVSYAKNQEQDVLSEYSNTINEYVKLVNETDRPEVYFVKYNQLIEKVKEVNNMDLCKSIFDGMTADEALAHIIGIRSLNCNNFIERYTEKIASQIKSSVYEYEKTRFLNLFDMSMKMYHHYMTEENILYSKEKYAELQRVPIMSQLKNSPYNISGFNGYSYDKQSKIVSIFTEKWRDICKKDFVVLDFETTGLSCVDDRIIEIAAIRYVNGIETNKFVSLVNPLMSIPSEATQVNNITNHMVADAPPERYLIPKLVDFLGDSLIVGHNVNFDVKFLEIAAQRYGYNVSYNYIDTISVSKKIFPGLPNYKLSTIAANLGRDMSGMHRAEEDVRVCAEIIQIALDSLE